jgi:hypothetical protein
MITHECRPRCTIFYDVLLARKKIYALLTCGGGRLVSRIHVGQPWKNGLISGKGRRFISPAKRPDQFSLPFNG